MNPIKSFSPRYEGEILRGIYCLGRLEKGKWICIERKNKVIRSDKLKEYQVHGDGTYAVIVDPEFVLPLSYNCLLVIVWKGYEY